MRYLMVVIVALCAIGSPLSAVAQETNGGSGWITIGGGFAGGEIDLPCADGQPREECREDGLFGALSAALTLGSETMLRFRTTGLLEQQAGSDDEDPQELALTIGTRLGPSSPWAAFIGGSRILHPDDDYPGREDGVALEFVFAPRAPGSTAGFEMGIHLFKSRDIEGGGMLFAARFGRL